MTMIIDSSKLLYTTVHGVSGREGGFVVDSALLAGAGKQCDTEPSSISEIVLWIGRYL